MKLGKFKHILASTLLIGSLALQAVVGVQSVSADATTDQGSTKIMLHKLAFDHDTQKPDITNDGSEQTITGATPLNDVEFTVTDVSEAYYSMTRLSPQDRQATIQADADKYVGEKTNSQTGITKDGGKLPLTLNNLGNNGKYAVYLIRETDSSNATDATTGKHVVVTDKEDPMVLVMPLAASSKADKDGYVHIYPKNETTEAFTKDLTKAEKDQDKDPNKEPDPNVVDDPNVAIVGSDETASYQVTAAIPVDATTTNYKITDTPDKGLNIDPSTVKVTDAKGTDITKDLDITANNVADKGNGFQINFSDSLLKSLASQTITITYDATVDVATTPDSKLDNTVTTVPGTPNEPEITSKTKVTTGGAKFKKVGDDTNYTGLAGAKFVLAEVMTDNSVKYAVADDKTGAITWSDDKSKANVSQTSDADGLFAFTGLQYSATKKANNKDFDSYAIVETQAPDGYAALTAPFKFTVNENSYGKTYQANSGLVTDPKKGILPHTGGMGIYVIIAAGLVVMGAAFFMLKKNRREEV